MGPLFPKHSLSVFFSFKFPQACCWQCRRSWCHFTTGECLVLGFVDSFNLNWVIHPRDSGFKKGGTLGPILHECSHALLVPRSVMTFYLSACPAPLESTVINLPQGMRAHERKKSLCLVCLLACLWCCFPSLHLSQVFHVRYRTEKKRAHRNILKATEPNLADLSPSQCPLRPPRSLPAPAQCLSQPLRSLSRDLFPFPLLSRK